ncbi:DUF2300 domain-containing protein [Shigella flexneri]
MTVAICTFYSKTPIGKAIAYHPRQQRHERVSASPATSGAERRPPGRRIPTEGDPVHYHGSRATEGTLSCGKPRPGGQGERYDQISRLLIPTTAWPAGGAPRLTCQLLPKAKAWLAKKMPEWRRRSQGETGRPNQTCLRLSFSLGFPYTDGR